MSATAKRQSKSQQINFRVTERQVDVLRRAAGATDSTLTDFVLNSAVDQAEKVLADRRWFTVTQMQWDDFVALLDADLPSATKFKVLRGRADVFSDDE
ncbi:DUF1778 domain-containing protein [Calidifontibacter indicus]|uniref:Uncharacterized protein (DUF1778 family) n=1 Tax=Calidifontibacter indicus TaxID=419650 RepID=A0A3D9US97_9MICO|nr:DUF1778 domain-containing protein [Calidifontibacter indicus]REF32126.1 uncharacterized protein (DUF1778 family) [Calidifontibacter indicus]